MGNKSGAVSITIVTHNSEPVLRRCMESVYRQDYPSLEVIIVDNQSTDGTGSILAEYKGRAQVIFNTQNRGFSAAQNQAIREASGDWILALNPDVMLAPNFVSCLLQGRRLDSRIGTVCGKLLRASPGLQIPDKPRLDSAGIYFTPTFRHFDRGLNRPDGEEYNQPAYVFGATGAAALYRRRMIEDVSIDGEFFDEDFFFFREDADVSWRAQLLGWRCLYLPEAVGYHVRRVFSGLCRRELPSDINLHSVKNRFLMRIKNATLPLYLHNVLSVTARDAVIVAYCLLVERSSLSAFPSVWRSWKRTLAKRRTIQKRRRVSDEYLQSWFHFLPVTAPAPLAPSTPAGAVASPNRDARSVLPFPAPKAEPSRLQQL